MDIRKVKKLIELLEESNIAELEIHEGEESVRISRYGSNAAVAAPILAAAPIAPPTAAPGETTSNETEISGHKVTSPMVGSFYRAPSPGAAPCQSGGHSVHHRGNETTEPDRSRQSRHHQGHPGRKRRAGGIRTNAVYH